MEETTRTSTFTFLAAAHALECLVHQNAQNLALGFQRHVGEFVDVERSAMGLFEGALRGVSAPVAVLDAEQLLLHALRRHGGGTQRNEGAIGAKRTAHAACARPVPCPRPLGR